MTTHEFLSLSHLVRAATAAITWCVVAPIFISLILVAFAGIILCTGVAWAAGTLWLKWGELVEFDEP